MIPRKLNEATSEITTTTKLRKRKYACLQERRLAKNSRRRVDGQTPTLSIDDAENVYADSMAHIVTSPDLLHDVPNCEFCDAKRIYLEPPTFCCSSGEINLSPTEMPSDLLQLYLDDTAVAKEFRTCVRSYNNMFAFTSMGVHCDKALASRNDGTYTFRVQVSSYLCKRRIWLASKIERLDHRQKMMAPRPRCSGEALYDIQNPINANYITHNEIQGSSKGTHQSLTVSCREYYCYKLQIRENDKSFLPHIGRLLQQYVVDMYIKIETSRLDFFRTKDMQGRLRNDIYRGLLDGIAQGCEMGVDVGKRIMLPSSFIGGPRDMRKRYMDVLTLVQRYGKSDIFLTMTSNPNWPEIKALCLPSDEIQNRPDLVARIFRAKLQVLKDELLKKAIFGRVVAYT
ncbi:uncharacterized protein [Primulina huaijiensis]|uniref:uncharacterized protein n=1 Tax=Primulina huaijiensis TaxID=1492673 RepID=UPI003CC71233